MEAAIREAIAIGGAEGAALASAAFQELDQLPKDARQGFRYPRRDVAETIVAEQHRATRQLVANVELLVSSAEISVTELLGIRPASTDKISHGLLRMKAEGRDGAGAAVRTEDDTDDAA